MGTNQMISNVYDIITSDFYTNSNLVFYSLKNIGESNTARNIRNDLFAIARVDLLDESAKTILDSINGDTGFKCCYLEEGNGSGEDEFSFDFSSVISPMSFIFRRI